MKKQELINSITDIFQRLDDLQRSMAGDIDDIRGIVRELEGLPSEPDEIEDDEKEKEDDN